MALLRPSRPPGLVAGLSLLCLVAGCSERVATPQPATRAPIQSAPAPVSIGNTAATRPRIKGGPQPQLLVERIPASAVAPWYVAQRINALTFSQRMGLTTVWGAYDERSEDPTFVNYEAQTQELGNAANGGFATYSGLDLGSGVDTVMLRVSLPTGTAPVEIRLGSDTGTLLGTCIVTTTGSTGFYRTVGCPVNASLARGRNQSLTFRFTGTNAGMRFNWFGFWARDTVQQIDSLMKVQVETATNRPSPTTPLAGTPVRTAAQLPAPRDILSRSYGAWAPSQIGDCPKWLHDTHWVRGDDGKVYPTWHPPVDMNPETGTYCTYGHEHGSDPRGSEMFALAGMPAFGFVNENHEPDNLSLRRNEDHFGHKVLVANNWTMYDMDGSGNRSCDLLLKLHVGTHSPDAFTNTAHELHAAGRCEGLEPFNVKQFALFGQAGGFKEAEAEGCNLGVNSGLTPVPANQPLGGVHRAIPTRDCFLRGSVADQQRLIDARSTEFWLTGLFGGNLYYTIGNPSRLYDVAAANKASRMVDLCYEAGHPLAITLRCQETVAASSARVPWNDPRSSYRGTVHTNSHFSKLIFANAASTTVYTDAWGRNASATPNPANGQVIRQLVPRQGFRYAVDGQASVIPNVDYSAGGRNGVRPPN